MLAKMTATYYKDVVLREVLATASKAVRNFAQGERINLFVPVSDKTLLDGTFWNLKGF